MWQSNVGRSKFRENLSVKSAEQKKMVESVEKVMAWRRVQEVKTHHVLDTERLEQQYHVAKVTPLFPSEYAPQILRKLYCTRRRRAPSGRNMGRDLDLGDRCWKHFRAEGVLREETETFAGGSAPRTPRTLLHGCL
jgi:hypothetical protein